MSSPAPEPTIQVYDKYGREFEVSREQWRKAPAGGVNLRVYAGGKMGGEAKMVSQMRLGALDAALLTATGLAERVRRVAIALDPVWAEHRYRQAVPVIGRVAHRKSGGLQNRVREGSIPSSPANLRAPPAGLSPKTLKVTAPQYE